MEVERCTGTRLTIDGCGNCYYYAYPCGQHDNTEMWQITPLSYVQFCRMNSKEHYPVKYEDFLADDRHPPPFQVANLWEKSTTASESPTNTQTPSL